MNGPEMKILDDLVARNNELRQMLAASEARAERLADEVQERRLLEFILREQPDDGPALADATIAIRKARAAVDAAGDLKEKP